MIRFVLLPLCAVAFFAVAFFAAPPAAAQDVVADTLDWRRYYPLAVGNVWEYHEAEIPNYLARHELIADTVAGPHRYFRRRTDLYREGHPNPQPPPAFDFVRYDPTGFVVAVPSLDADTVAANPCSELNPFERPLRLAFGALVACPPGEWASELRVEGGYGSPRGWDGGPSEELPAVAWKEFLLDGLFTEFVADVGPVAAGNLWGPRLHYARVGGAEYGASRMTTAAEPLPPPPAALAVRVLENPARSHVAFEVVSAGPGSARWEVFDVAGRRVRSGAVDLLGEPTRVELPVSGLAPGAYFVRVVAGGGGSASRAFTAVR